ncbi:MAG: hypothetical protein HXY50_06135 [Ignavibacteriaceae bacterium]|nr:hypothetical protein [Ignavibacteriaceae bacterium]
MITRKNFIALILLLMFFTISIIAQQKNDVYNFPIKPGMLEWKELKTHDEMLKVLQLPSRVMKSISTSSLVMTCLNYPLFSDMWAYNNIKEGFEQLRKDFNELVNRKDALAELLKFYEKMDPDAIDERSTLLDKGRYTAELCKLEIILTQPELYKNSSSQLRRSLLKEILIKHDKMLDHDEYDMRSIESNIFLMGNILRGSNFTSKLSISKNKKVNYFINTSMFVDKDIIKEIVSLSKELFNNQ